VTDFLYPNGRADPDVFFAKQWQTADRRGPPACWRAPPAGSNTFARTPSQATSRRQIGRAGRHNRTISAPTAATRSLAPRAPNRNRSAQDEEIAISMLLTFRDGNPWIRAVSAATWSARALLLN